MRFRGWDRRSKIRSLYTSYIETRTAYSVFAFGVTDKSLISGNCGRAEGRWGTLRLGTLETKDGSCTSLPKRILACFLVDIDVFSIGRRDEGAVFPGRSCWDARATVRSVGLRREQSESKGSDPAPRPKIDH